MHQLHSPELQLLLLLLRLQLEIVQLLKLLFCLEPISRPCNALQLFSIILCVLIFLGNGDSTLDCLHYMIRQSRIILTEKGLNIRNQLAQDKQQPTLVKEKSRQSFRDESFDSFQDKIKKTIQKPEASQIRKTLMQQLKGKQKLSKFIKQRVNELSQKLSKQENQNRFYNKMISAETYLQKIFNIWHKQDKSFKELNQKIKNRVELYELDTVEKPRSDIHFVKTRSGFRYKERLKHAMQKKYHFSTLKLPKLTQSFMHKVKQV